MPERPPNDDALAPLNVLAGEIYGGLADHFPVCLSSDEFHFFPHFINTTGNPPAWDDFSDNSVLSVLAKISQWHRRLDQLKAFPADTDSDLDIEMLSRVLTTLEEQLSIVCPHKTQPTFYLTILSIGLSESFEQSREIFDDRIAALPNFLKAAAANLMRVPTIFAELALEMLPKLRDWIMPLPITDGARRSIKVALDTFYNHLQLAEKSSDFRLPEDLYARVADFHIGCRMSIEEIGWHLEEEIRASNRYLVRYAHHLCPGTPWQAVFHQLPSPEAVEGDIVALFQRAIARIKDHCLENGFFLSHDVADCEVDIQTIAEHMAPVRANAAYTMPPGHPPSRGVFYTLPVDRQPLSPDLMMLTAHETYPGHHLLDTLRWQLPRPVRRPLEFPLFYEGWASFSEEILFDSAFFSGPVDRLLTAKRRFWRAHRGLADLNIHSGRRRLEEAAAELSDIGLVSRIQALAMVRRYALKPGYQLSYAIGRRKFHHLYLDYVGLGYTPGQFVRKTLSEGEIGFDHLSRMMLR